MTKKPSNKQSTSWGGVAEWYGEYLDKTDTYQSKVILPNLIRMLDIKKGAAVLDLACGQGFFARELVKLGATVVGSDISTELIKNAKKNVPHATFYASPASKLTFSKSARFDVVICVLALQNMDDLAPVFAEVKRVLKPGGRFVFVLNHPTFRVLKRSSWGFDDKEKVQYRRVDGYLSGAKISIDMHPGKAQTKQTISYHRSLQDFFKALSKYNFAVTRLEEWISHKESGKGPRQKAEDIARKEIPLFMAIEAVQK
jgi:ubiquinone/menaquinone biosynthesis C-methylase UbiE